MKEVNQINIALVSNCFVSTNHGNESSCLILIAIFISVETVYLIEEGKKLQDSCEKKKSNTGRYTSMGSVFQLFRKCYEEIEHDYRFACVAWKM